MNTGNDRLAAGDLREGHTQHMNTGNCYIEHNKTEK